MVLYSILTASPQKAPLWWLPAVLHISSFTPDLCLCACRREFHTVSSVSLDPGLEAGTVHQFPSFRIYFSHIFYSNYTPPFAKPAVNLCNSTLGCRDCNNLICTESCYRFKMILFKKNSFSLLCTIAWAFCFKVSVSKK